MAPWPRAVTSARTLFQDGEKGAARAQLEALVRSRDVTVSRRASFTLAEMAAVARELPFVKDVQALAMKAYRP